MLECKVLISEFVAVDGLATGTVVVGKVTALAHELGNHAVEDTSFVAVSFLACAEGTEILGCLGDDVGTQFHFDAACWAVADGDVKVHDWIRHAVERKRIL
jgi:hypothetical protein